MDLMCRLCCSTMFVNNDIFDEENALYLKMSLYLPIKVFKNDGLPNKICNRCSCKVNDLYQFCNETIEVQSRLRAILFSNSIVEDTVDLTRVKENASPPPIYHKLEQSTQTDENAVQNETLSTEQSGMNIKVTVKQEPISSEIKEELSNEGFDRDFSDDDEISLISLKRQKKEKVCNGEKRSKKKKGKLKDWLMTVLPKEKGLKVLDSNETSEVLPESKDLYNEETDRDCMIPIDASLIKEEIPEPVYNCCVCLATCYNRADIVQHYKSHVDPETLEAPPPAPALPDKEPYRCARCNKCVKANDWSVHWVRHWSRDLRPYRCGLCEKTFRDPYQILKHATNAHSDAAAAGRPAPPSPRFLCDGCPSRFVYMRCLTAHRDLAHPELRARPLELRCPTCGRAFAHLNSLRRHLRSHSGERNFLCNVCGKALSSREHLKFHIRIHTGDKPNVCGTCGKGFVKKCNLTLHERVHSGEKPHVCSHCGKAFSQRSTLVIHERYHSGARPYVCSLCGRGFVAKGLLSMHLKSTCI